MKIETAIKKLKVNYEYALKNDYIKDKIAWALYVTWKEVEQMKSGKEYKKQTIEGEVEE